MRAIVFSDDNVIGTADLQAGDIDMGHVYGIFTPNDLYFSLVQKEVWNFWSTSNHFVLNSLKLSVQLDNSHRLKPIGGITIDDLHDFKNDYLQIDIAGLPFEDIDTYFKNDKSCAT
jgi:hypothetical protein